MRSGGSGPGVPAGRLRVYGSAMSGPGHRGEGRPGVVDGEREHRDAVERAAGRHRAGGRDHAEARLQADDIAEAGRHAARARRVGAERERHQPGRDRDARARAGPAGNELWVERIARHPIGRAHADETGRELVEIGLADRDRAGGAQPLHAGRVGLRRVGEGRARGGGRQAGDIDVVLDGERHAVERQRGVALLRPAPRLGDGVGFVAQRDEDRGVVVLADARVGARDRVFRAMCRSGGRRGSRRWCRDTPALTTRSDGIPLPLVGRG